MCTALSPGDQLELSAHSCQHYPSQSPIWAAQLPSQRLGYVFLPTPVPAGFLDPPSSLGRVETECDAPGRAADKVDLTMIWPRVFQQSEQFF